MNLEETKLQNNFNKTHSLKLCNRWGFYIYITSNADTELSATQDKYVAPPPPEL